MTPRLLPSAGIADPRDRLKAIGLMALATVCFALLDATAKYLVTVDNLEVAQFVYILLHNEKIRDVIDTIGKKGVLLLNRFTEGRMLVLERLRDKLRDLGFVPMVFNFDKPETKDFSETVRLLCNLSHFVIVDITNPRSAPLELQATVPDYMVPFCPILQDEEQPFSMFVDLQNKYDWVLQPVVGYPQATACGVHEDLRLARAARWLH